MLLLQLCTMEIDKCQSIVIASPLASLSAIVSAYSYCKLSEAVEPYSQNVQRLLSSDKKEVR